MKAYQFFRGLSYLCIPAIIFISGLFFLGFTDEKYFGVVSGIIAILATIFGIFAAKPIEKRDVTGAVDELLLTYDKDTYASLQEAKKEEKTLREFIENRSEELLLLKIRSYLEQEVKNRYEELVKIENKLDSLNVEYGTFQLPERFKRLIQELDEGTKRELWKRLLAESFSGSTSFLLFFIPASVRQQLAYEMINLLSEQIDAIRKDRKKEDSK